MLKLTTLSVLGLLASSARIALGAVPSVRAPANFQRAPIVKRATPSPPYFVIYSDDWVTNALPPVSDVEGYNVYALSFLWSTGGQDQAQNWEELTAAVRSSSIATYHAAGIYVVASAFGSVPLPTTDGSDPASTANFMADWVVEYGLDGIDVDYEDLDCFDNTSCNPEAWLETFTQTLRQTLTQGEYILSHAPLAPWFSPSLWTNGGYLAIHKSVGNLIDFYNMQFYNQGTSEYTTCAGLLDASSSTWPETALFQISANGVTLDKIVVGKPATTADASNGYVDPGTLAGCLEDAFQQGWNGGAMVWQYPHADAAWIASVRASAWPVGKSITSPVSTPTSGKTSTTTTTSGGGGGGGGGTGNCAGISAWSASVAYSSGSKVTYSGDLWISNQWSDDEAPGGAAGAWVNSGACASAAPIVPATFSVPSPTAHITATPHASAAGVAHAPARATRAA